MIDCEKIVADGKAELQRIKDLSQASANKGVQSILRRTVRIEYLSLACLACVVFMIILNFLHSQKQDAAIETNKTSMLEMKAALQNAMKLTNK